MLPIGWVKSTNFFCAASDTFANNANGYVLEPTATFVVYPPTSGAYKTFNGSTASPKCLQYVDVYMDGLLCAAQGDTTQNPSVG